MSGRLRRRASWQWRTSWSISWTSGPGDGDGDALRRYGAEPVLASYEFTLGNRPEADTWSREHAAALELL
jgi:hypothetical protein